MDKILEFAIKFAKLSILEREIIELFHKESLQGNPVIGGYSDITRKLGRKCTGKDSDGIIIYGEEPNIRKACLRLVQMNVLIPDDHGKNKFYLSDKFVDNIINN